MSRFLQSYLRTHGARQMPLRALWEKEGNKLGAAGDIRALAAEACMPEAALRGVLSFYDDLRHEAGAVRVCRGTSCLLAGSAALHEGLARETPCRGAYCLGYCDRSPAVMRGNGGVVAACRGPRDLQEAPPEPGPPSVRCAAPNPVVTARLGAGGGLDAARAAGVYEALRRALDMDPQDLLRLVEDSGLRGRGGAAFPTGRKWRACAEAAGDVRYVIANGDEGDPGSFIDRVLMEDDPHSVLEGLALCARAVGADSGVVFMRSEYPAAIAAMERAIAEARAAGILGRSAMGSGFAFDAAVFPGLGSYVCGEETALLNAIEGMRGEVRLRPPYPTQRGLFGCPTVVDNVETLVNVPWIVRHGAEEYRRLGTAESSGTKALCLNHGFARPGIVEVEFGTTLRQVIEREAGGPRDGRGLAAVLLGGPMGSVVPPEEWDVPICYSAMGRRGIQLGHGGLVALPQDADVRALFEHWLEFMQDESCGKCVPCRLGSRQALAQVRSDRAGENRPAIERLLDVMADGSLCAFGQQMPRPMRRMLELFGDRIFGPGRAAERAVSAPATIDGRGIVPEPGQTILAAARRLGIDIPALCFLEGAPPEGGCRVCLVETGAERPAAACCTGLAPGMTVRTQTPRLAALRRDIVALMAAERAPELRARPDGSPFERLMARLDVKRADLEHDAPHGDPDLSHPYLRFERDRCITCRRCVAACESVPGRFVFGLEGRGGGTRLIYGPTERFADSPCIACGACVDACPTGAISDRDRAGAAAPQASVESVCGYCGVGCRVRIGSARGQVLRIDGVESASVNLGQLCVKGRYAHAYHRAADRLTRPLLREGNELRPVSWERAISWAAQRLAGIRDRHGPDALGVMTSSRSTNEACYLLQKLFRTAIGTNNVDCCARVCHSSTATALRLMTGTGAASASFDDVERASCIVVAGANPTEAHPVVGQRIKQAALQGVPLIVIDPRRIELADYATEHLALRPGTNVALFNALARAIIDAGRIDPEYIAQRTEGFEALRAAALAGPSPAAAAGACGLDPRQIARAAALLGRGPALYVTGLGLSESVQGTASVMALCNVAMLTGAVGRRGAGMLPLRGQNNVQGNADMGAMPDMVTGYQPVADEGVRRRVAAVWGAAPPHRPGLTIGQMIDAAARRQVRGLWIQGEDVAQSDPSQDHVVEALRALDLLVVQELFMSETAQHAHLVLPAAAALEQEGTFTNAERRIQRVRAAVPAPGEARPDWAVACELAAAMGAAWRYAGPAQVMEEIGRVAPDLFGGVGYERLEGDGLQWPCPARGHPGTATVHGEGFLHGRGRFIAVEYAPGPEDHVRGFPYLLITGRVLDHYNVGTMTRRTPNSVLVGADMLEIHPQDALGEGIADGATVALESTWGRITVAARHSARIAPGTLFLSFHFPETHANRLVGPHVDPVSRCPDYKLTSVRVRPLN